MQKVLLSFSIALLLCSCANAKEKKKLTDEELIAKIMQLDKEQDEAREKTAKMKEKTKALNELGQLLQVDK